MNPWTPRPVAGKRVGLYHHQTGVDPKRQPTIGYLRRNPGLFKASPRSQSRDGNQRSGGCHPLRTATDPGDWRSDL